MYTEIPLIAQVVRDESELAAKPFYIDSLNMRSVNGKMETKYGQELFSSTALTGICRGMLTWGDLTGNRWAAFGTHLRVQISDSDGNFTDITPVIERGALTNPFTTVNASAEITVTDDAHNLVANQKVTYSPSSAANVLISGDYSVSSVITSSSYTFTASTVAGQSTAAVGGTVDYAYGLAPGNQSNLGGLGYGVGGFGTGGYGAAASSQDLDARTCSFAQWGQNLIVNPSWGGIYEWAPNISATELVSAGDFASTSTWVQGSGWFIAAGTASASGAAKLSQPLSLVRSAWHLLRFDIVRNSGTITPLIGTSTVGAVVVASATIKRAFYSPVSTSQTLIFDGASAFNGQIDNVSLKVITTAENIPGSPSSAGSIFVTAERNLVACGSTDAISGLLDPLEVRWCAAENNQDWTASAANVAGSWRLSHGTKIIRGLPGNRENIIFTDTAVYRMRSVPDPAVIYAFDLLGEGCGLIGPNAAVQVNGTFFWVSPQGQFYQYNGGPPTPLPNPSQRDYLDNLANVQGRKIYAYHNAAKNEVGWIYPDERDGIECSREHVFNYMSQMWVSGAFARTAYIDAGIFPFPLATDPNGKVFYQEKDFSSDGSARQTMLETSYFNFGAGSGENFGTILGFRPDFDNLQGGGKITFFSKLYSQASERVYGPFMFTSATKQISVRIKGRQIKYRVETNDAPSFYRWGAGSFDIKASGQKK